MSNRRKRKKARKLAQREDRKSRSSKRCSFLNDDMNFRGKSVKVENSLNDWDNSDLTEQKKLEQKRILRTKRRDKWEQLENLGEV